MQIGFRITEVIDLVPEMICFILAQDRDHLLIAAQAIILMLGAIFLGYLADIVDIAILIYCVGIGNHLLLLLPVSFGEEGAEAVVEDAGTEVAF